MFDASSLRKLKLPALFVLLLLIAFAGYYVLLLRSRTTYLNSSNRRLLTTIGHQIDEWVERQQYFFGIVLANPKGEDLLKTWKTRRVSENQWNIAPGPRPTDTSSIDVEPPTLFVDSSGKTWLEQAWRDNWRRVAFDAPILESLQSDVFDMVLLATPDGRILKRSGAPDLYLTDLSSLLTPGEFTKESSHTADVDVHITGTGYRLFMQPCCAQLRNRSPNTGRLAGEKEPDASTTPTPSATPETDNRKQSVASGTRTGLVVCGLIRTATLVERRLAISFSTMLIIGGLLLMIVVSWPFMKLALIGPRQRVGLLDVLLLGISSLLVLSLATLYLLDFYAYQRLKMHIDAGLTTLSASIQSNMRREITAAYSQLKVLESAARKQTGPPVVEDILRKHPDPDLSFYPFFESFSLIDSSGQQTRKWSLRERTPPLVSVKERDYFLQVTEHRTWSLPRECDHFREDRGVHICDSWLPAIGPLALESNRSITRMTTQAVLAIPTAPPADGLRVAALALPMMSLIKPVLPPGFGFAVIEDKDAGLVLFHSDERRNLIEHFFLETDLNRRLRSVVAARRDELLDVRYWGDDYRAFVTPLRGFPWSLVTFYEKDLVRSVNVDWIVTALLFMVLYVTPCACVCVFILVRPGKRATWLWPHPRGLTAYLHLAAVYIAVIIAFGATIYAAGHELGGRRVPDWILPFFAFAFPLLAWLLTYVRLRAARRATPIAGDESADPTRVAGARAWAEPNELLSLSYMCWAALLLVITAVMPTLAFFKLAHSIQVIPFIKYTQLKLATGLEERRQRAAKEFDALSPAGKEKDLAWEGEAARSGLSERPSTVLSRRVAIGSAQLQFKDGEGVKQALPVDIDDQAFGTTVTKIPQKTERNGEERSLLPGFLEPLLPYYSEASVAMRELLHDQAADKSRYWSRGPENRIILTSNAYGDGDLRISSVIPTFGSLPPLFDGEDRLHLLLLMILFCTIGALALAIVSFAARRIFLLDVPFWSSGWSGFSAPGQSVFVVCRRRELRETYLAGRQYEKLDLADIASPKAKADDWNAALSRLEKVLSGEPILLDHFEEGTDDSRLSAKKLWLVEQLVQRRRRLVILCSIGPFPLEHGGLAGEPAPKTEGGPSVEQRWAALLTSSFVVIDLDPRFETDSAAPSRPPGRMTRLERTLGTGWQALLSNFSGWVKVRQYRAVRRVLERECAGNPYLSSIHDDLSRMIRRRGEEGLDREEILADLEERASNYYEALWACCSPVEKLVLEHLAQDGFANYRDGKVVRRLISRGLVRRDPHLRLMNETFRRFVVSTRRRTEVVKVEQETQASAWDHFRRPFATILAFVLVLFVTTQKARFDAMMALIVGMTGVLPSLLKLAGLLIGERSSLPAKPS